MNAEVRGSLSLDGVMSRANGRPAGQRCLGATGPHAGRQKEIFPAAKQSSLSDFLPIP